jgi:hypothetical protein
MKVQAMRLGYYSHRRRRPGDVFRIRDKKDFSKQWMREYKGKGKVKTLAEEDAESAAVVDEAAVPEETASDQIVI